MHLALSSREQRRHTSSAAAPRMPSHLPGPSRPATQSGAKPKTKSGPAGAGRLVNRQDRRVLW